MMIRRDSAGNLILASWHPKWSLTWSWVLAWNLRRGGRWFYSFRTNKYRPGGGLYGRIAFGRLTLERQPTMRISDSAA